MKFYSVSKFLLTAIALMSVMACSNKFAMQGLVTLNSESLPKFEPRYKGKNASFIEVISGNTQEAVGIKFFFRSELTQCSTDLGTRESEKRYCEVTFKCPEKDCSLSGIIMPVKEGNRVQSIDVSILTRGDIQVKSKGEDFWPANSSAIKLDPVKFRPPAIADNNIPTVKILDPKPTNNGPAKVVSFSFEGSDLDGSDADASQNLSYTCYLDNASVPCGTGQVGSVSSLAFGGNLSVSSHTFVVVANDASNNVSSIPGTRPVVEGVDKYTWTVSASNVSCQLLSQISGVRKNTSENIQFNCEPVAEVDWNSLACTHKGASIPCNSVTKTVNITAPISQGAHDIRIAVKDIYGDDGAPAEASWFSDTKVPTIVCPQNNWINALPANYGATCTDLQDAINSSCPAANIKCKFNGAGQSTYGVCQLPANYPDTLSGQITFDKVSIIADDVAGNSAVSIDCNLRFDKSPPSNVAFAPPSPGDMQTVGGGQGVVAFKFDASDVHSGIKDYQYKLGAAQSWTNCGDASGNCSMSVSENTPANPTHTVQVRAVNNADLNSAVASSRTFIYSNAAPTCTIKNFVDPDDSTVVNSFSSKAIIKVKFSCEMAGKNVAAKCAIDNGVPVDCGGAANSTPIADFFYTSNALNEGVRTFKIWPVNPTNSQLGDVVTQSITVDLTNPVITCNAGFGPFDQGQAIPSPKNGNSLATPAVPALYACTDTNGCDNSSDSCFWNSSNGLSGTNNCTSFPSTVNNQAVTGLVIVTVQKKDNSGRISPQKDCQFSIAAVPVVTFTKPTAPDSFYGDTYQFQWTVDDPSGGTIVDQVGEVFLASCTTVVDAQANPPSMSFLNVTENKLDWSPILGNGVYYLRVRAKSSSGKWSVAQCSPAITIEQKDTINRFALGKRNACIAGKIANVSGSNNLQCWGYNGTQLQLYAGGATSDSVTSKTSHPGKVWDIALGFDHTCTIVSDIENNSYGPRQIYCWGSVANGRIGGTCGQSAQCDYTLKKTITLPRNVKPLKLSLGSDHSCVLVDEPYSSGNPLDYSVESTNYGKGVYCWGNNTLGQLGYCKDAGGTMTADIPSQGGCRSTYNSSDPATSAVLTVMTQSLAAIPVYKTGNTRLRKVLDISAGSQYTCAQLASQGPYTSNVYCWGNNSNKRLGAQSINSSALARTVDVNDVVQLAVGSDHACAIKLNSVVQGNIWNASLYCWGAGTSMKILAGGTSSGYDTPQLVQNFRTDITRYERVDLDIAKKPGKQLALADASTCIIDMANSNGTVRCWGSSGYNQLGYGSTNVWSVDGNQGILNPDQINSYKDHWNNWTWWVTKSDGTGARWGQDRALTQDEFNTRFNNSCASDLKASVLAENFQDTAAADGSIAAGSYPRLCTQISNVRYLAAGDAFYCAVKKDDDAKTSFVENKVFCWGNNSDFRLGAQSADGSSAFTGGSSVGPLGKREQTSFILNED